MKQTESRLANLSPEKRALLALRLSQSLSAESVSEPLPALVARPEKRYEPFPLTDLQQAYWIGRSGEFEMGQVASHCYYELDVHALDLERLERALGRLIDRHDMLRAIVSPDGHQRVLEDVPPYRIEVLDLRGQSPEAIGSRLDDLRTSLSHQILPSDVWPLFEIRAVRLDRQTTRLFISLDALIVDAWSIYLFFEEWGLLYANDTDGLSDLDISFRDYVIAEKSLEESSTFGRDRDYWRDRIETLPPAPVLPLATNPASLTRQRFVRREGRLEPEVWTRLKARASRAGLTPTGVLLAAYAEVLSAWSANRRFSLSVPRFNRLPLHPQVNRLIGEFASFTVLDVDNSADTSFEERAQAHQRRLWEDLDHSSFNGVRVLRALSRVRDSADVALVPVVFTAAPQDSRGQDASILGAAQRLGPITYAINQTSQVWLDNHVVEHEGSLLCQWDSVDALFPEGMSQDLFEAFFRLLHLLASNEGAWARSWAELARVLVPPTQIETRAAINGVTAPIPEVTIPALFARQIEARADAQAVVSSDRILTYEDLDRLSNQWGRRLRELGAQPGKLVAIVMEKGWEQVVGVLGVLRSGAAYVPVDADVPRERLWFLLENSEVEVVLTQSRLDRALQWPETVRRLCVDTDDLSAVSDETLEPAQTPDDLALCLYTSGSTGDPKGVMVAHRGVVNALLRTNDHFKIGPTDRVLALTALHHDMSVYDIFGILAAGGTIVLPDASGRRDPAHWSELLRRENVTVWNSVPAMMEMLLEYASGRSDVFPESLRWAFLGGDWIQVPLPGRLTSLVEGARVVSVGGPTETTLWNIWYPVEEVNPEWKSIPYGKPIANTRYYVLNDALEDCPTWVPGEMYVAGVGLALGYWRDESRTREKFLRHPRSGERLYRTGDRGRYLPDGNIEFLGRVDFQVKIQGQRIELGEVESALVQHASVKAAVASAVGEHAKRRLVVYFVPERGRAPSESELRSFLEEKLPPPMVPAVYVRLGQLPLTTNGKVDRKALPDPSLTFDETDEAAPERVGTVRQAEIAELVAKVLELESIDPEANLLGYGANSIDMVRIGNQLEEKYGSRPRIDQLFRLQTIAALAQYYEEHSQAPESSVDSTHRGEESDVDSLMRSYTVMLDPDERAAFRKSQPGIRRGDDERTFIQLIVPEEDEALRQRYRERRSYRKFSLKPISFEQFSQFLACLYEIRLDGAPKYLYGSPGGLYPTQTYLHIKPGRVEGVPAGVYYHHPIEHRLVTMTPDAEIDRSIHVPFINAPIFDEGAFSVFFITQFSAIAPAYGEHSLHFVTIEAGLMAQLMETVGPRSGIGLCQIGSVDFDKVRGLFALDSTHVLIHSMIGGRIVEGDDHDAKAAASTERDSDRVERLLDQINDLSAEEVRNLLSANRPGGSGVTSNE